MDDHTKPAAPQRKFVEWSPGDVSLAVQEAVDGCTLPQNSGSGSGSAMRMSPTNTFQSQGSSPRSPASQRAQRAVGSDGRASSDGRKRGGRKRLSLDGQTQWTTRLAMRMKKLDMDDDDERVSQASIFETGALQSFRARTRRLASSAWFEAAMGIVIIANAIAIGLHQSAVLMEPQPDTAIEVLNMLEHLFLSIYVIELGMNLVGHGRKALQDNWIRFDIFLVITGVAVTWIVDTNSDKDTNSMLGFVVVLRTLRVLRLVRAVRLLIRFKELWMLVQGLMNSASTMFYTLVLLAVILYILSSIGIEAVTHNPRLADNPEVEEILERYFDSLPRIMLTLMQFVCLDSIHAIYKPLIEQDPWLAIYFVLVILIVAVVLMNLVTAVIVSGAFEQARKDQELLNNVEARKRQRMVKDLRKMFQRLDADNSGKLSMDELASIGEEDRQVLAQATAVSDPLEIFMALDVDDKGSVDIDEFCEGVWQVLVSQSPLEIKRMEKQLNFLRRDMRSISREQAVVLESLNKILRNLDLPSQGLMSSVTESQVSGFGARIASLRSTSPAGFERSKSPDLDEAFTLYAGQQSCGDLHTGGSGKSLLSGRSNRSPRLRTPPASYGMGDNKVEELLAKADSALGQLEVEEDVHQRSWHAVATEEPNSPLDVLPASEFRGTIRTLRADFECSLEAAKAHIEAAESKGAQALAAAEEACTTSWDRIEKASSMLEEDMEKHPSLFHTSDSCKEAHQHKNGHIRSDSSRHMGVTSLGLEGRKGSRESQRDSRSPVKRGKAPRARSRNGEQVRVTL